MEFPAGGEVAGRVERFPAEWIWPDRQIALYEWLLPEGAAVEYPLHQDALGEHRQSLLQKGIGFVRKRGQRGIRQIQGIMRGARCIGSMGMQGGAWRWRRKVWKNGFLHER